MEQTICFAANGASVGSAADRHLVAAKAMRRYVPPVVAWGCAQAGAPISLVLPEQLSVRELVQRAARERVEVVAVSDPAAPDRAFELHYTHLDLIEIEEGIRRLGRCLALYRVGSALELARPCLSLRPLTSRVFTPYASLAPCNAGQPADGRSPMEGL